MINLFSLCEIDAQKLQDHVEEANVTHAEYKWAYGREPEFSEIIFHQDKYYHPNFPKVSLTRYQMFAYRFLLTIDYNFYCNSFLYLLFHCRNKCYIEFIASICFLKENGMIKYKFKTDLSQNKEQLLISVYDQFGNNLNNLIKPNFIKIGKI